MAYWVVRDGVIAASLRRLLGERLHPTFAGYLCLKRTAAREGRTVELKPDFREFFKTFLAVPGGPEPHLRPFWDEKLSASKAWYQGNVAGTYSAGSARRIVPFMKVVEVEGTGRAATYSLRPGHSELAREHLAFNNQVPVIPLVAFLYRDYALDTDDPPRSADLVRIFRDEFGYPTSSAQAEAEFSHLYLDESRTTEDAGWYEVVP